MGAEANGEGPAVGAGKERYRVRVGCERDNGGGRCEEVNAMGGALESAGARSTLDAPRVIPAALDSMANADDGPACKEAPGGRTPPNGVRRSI